MSMLQCVFAFLKLCVLNIFQCACACGRVYFDMCVCMLWNEYVCVCILKYVCVLQCVCFSASKCVHVRVNILVITDYLGGKPFPLKQIVRYKIISILARFWAKKRKKIADFFWFFSVNLDITDKILSIITEIRYKGVRYNGVPLYHNV